MTTAVSATTPSSGTGSVTALLVGGPTLLLEYAGLRVLTDPTFDAPGEFPSGPVTLRKLAEPAVSADELGPVDVVLLSHDHHPDNLDPAGRAYLKHAGTVLSTTAAAERIPGVRGLTPGQTATVGAVTVAAVHAQHGPDGTDELTGPVIGFILTAKDAPTVYVSGDNASVAVVREIAAEFGRIDIAVLFTGAANVGLFGDSDLTLNSRTAIEAARELGDALIVPVHAEGWWHFTETRERLAQAFDYAGLTGRLLILAAGVRTVLPQPR